MPFKLISRPDPAPREFLVTNSESIVYGECLKFSSGRLTKAAAGDAVACVAVQAVAGGVNQTCKVIIVTPEQEWEVGYTGTPDAGFVVGCATADLASTGDALNAADITGGPCAILSIDAANCKAVVKFKNRQLA